MYWDGTWGTNVHHTSMHLCHCSLVFLGSQRALAHYYHSTLSPGYRARLVFCLMSLRNPHLLLLDEPTNPLDMDMIDSLALAIKKFNGGVVLVSHDFKLLDQVLRCRLPTLARPHGRHFTKLLCAPVSRARAPCVAQVAETIWVCEHKTITPWKGDIKQYKDHLRKQMAADAKKLGMGAGAGVH